MRHTAINTRSQPLRKRCDSSLAKRRKKSVAPSWTFAERWLLRKYPATPRDLAPLIARLANIGGRDQ
jgi:hypothetical protein